MDTFGKLTEDVCAAPRELVNTLKEMNSVLLKIMELTVFKLTSNENALHIAKPFLNDENVAVERSYVSGRAELGIEAKQFLNGKCLAEVLHPGIEAFVMLSGAILGNAGVVS